MTHAPGRRRHPCCPECGHDLSGTIEGGGRSCPECGRAFEVNELPRRGLPGAWTAARGLRRAHAWLVIRSAPCAVVWCAVLWWMIPHIAPWRGGVWSPGVPLAGFLGLLIGAALSLKLADQAGFVSPLLAVIESLFALAIIAGGLALVEFMGQPLPTWSLRVGISAPAFLGALASICGVVLTDN